MTYSSIPLSSENDSPDAVYIGVSGSRRVTREQSYIILKAVCAMPSGAYLAHRACEGADIMAAMYAHSVRRGIGIPVRIHAVLPPDRRLAAPDWRMWSSTFEEIEPGPDGYKRRNQRIVDLSDRLIAFPLYAEDHPDSRRSGTWQTIRMARRKGITVDVHVLSGGA